ncbi:50S ribosomal protein L6 [Candidatus Woesearchaeota archaeon]|nr:50S ribosomal protein L6 [Candidatus Woesearchaeota archaeon]
MKSKIDTSIELPQGVTASFASGVLLLKGPKGEVARKLADPLLVMKVEPNKVVISCPKGTKRQKRMMNTFEAHINNMTKGVQEPYQYRLKICSGHFPMNVSVTGDQLIVKNFLGEKSPRTLKLKKGVTVKVDGDKLLVESSDKELAGQMASDIELITAKRNRDLRVFQDGIYMIEKAGKAW